MKLQAHLPVGISPRDWHAAMIALGSLFAAAVLLLVLQSGGLFDNPALGWMRTSPIVPPQTSVAHRVSLDLHLRTAPISPWQRFSVARPLPANAASSQRFSVGMDERAVFQVFGEAALRDVLNEKGAPQLKSRNDRVLLTLMLLGLDTRRR